MVAAAEEKREAVVGLKNGREMAREVKLSLWISETFIGRNVL